MKTVPIDSNAFNRRPHQAASATTSTDRLGPILEATDEMARLTLFVVLIGIGSVLGALFYRLFFPAAAIGIPSYIAAISAATMGATFGMLLAGLFDVTVVGSLDERPEFPS
jgi:hypothetical protein